MGCVVKQQNESYLISKEEYEQSKQISFRLLYGGVDKDFAKIPFFGKVKEFTYKLDSQVDMIQFHLVAFAKIDKPDLQERKKTGISLEKTIKEKRKVDFDQMGIHESNIYDFDLLEPDMEFNGPAIVEDASTTVVVFPNQKCKVDNYANLHISIFGELNE